MIDEVTGPTSGAQNATIAVWRRGGFTREYRSRRLRPPETVLLSNHRAQLSGRVLELGVGGGRITSHLLELADSLHGIDIGADMVEYCRRSFPQATFAEGDIRDLGGHDAASADAVVAGFNLIDVLDDAHRGRLFDEIHRILAPGGLLLFSSHNLACVPLVKGPLRTFSRNPLRTLNRIARLPRSIANHRRLVPLQRFESEYAIVNDVAHDYSLLHYYIGRDGQERQLEAHGFTLLECLDANGDVVPPGDPAFGCHELHYAAIRVDTADEPGAGEHSSYDAPSA